MPTPSSRSEIAPFRVMQILERAQAMDDALLLCVGQPGADAPEAVLAAAEAALHTPLGYTPTLGTPTLRETIAAWHRKTYGVDTTAEQVVVTTGSSGGFVALFLAALEHGDTVALTRPGYPAYRNVLQSIGANIVELPCGPETRFQPTVAHLEALEQRPKMVLITSPDNPSGTIIDPAELAAIAKWCEQHDVLLVSDEIYHGISYGRECATARSSSDQAVVVGSLSKYFCMTGWRLGWLIVPPQFVEPLENLLASLALCPPAITQHAALAAFDCEDYYQQQVAQYAEVREFLLGTLPTIGLDTFAPPDGGFYLWIDIASLSNDSEAFCAAVLEQTGVALAPGTDFDAVDGQHYVRMSFCVDLATATEAIRRLGTYLAQFVR